MSTKKVLVICTQILFIKTVFSQCYGRGNNAGTVSGNSLNSGGSFVVTSSSPVSPTGLSVTAEALEIDGAVAVNGKLPLYGSVSVDGSVPAGGQASVLYSCGDGNIGMSGAGVPAGYGGGLPNGLNGLGRLSGPSGLH